jgi:hypothetical protein
MGFLMLEYCRRRRLQGGLAAHRRRPRRQRRCARPRCSSDRSASSRPPPCPSGCPKWPGAPACPARRVIAAVASGCLPVPAVILLIPDSSAGPVGRHVDRREAPCCRWLWGRSSRAGSSGRHSPTAPGLARKTINWSSALAVLAVVSWRSAHSSGAGHRPAHLALAQAGSCRGVPAAARQAVCQGVAKPAGGWRWTRPVPPSTCPRRVRTCRPGPAEERPADWQDGDGRSRVRPPEGRRRRDPSW